MNSGGGSDRGTVQGAGGGVRPAVAVIVPCFNAADTLAETIDSIRAQTHEDWELICIDDGSTDATPGLLAACADADPRIRWIRGRHGGPGAARNIGLDHAGAQHVLFLDADDRARPEALATLLSAVRAAGGSSIATGGYELTDRDGRALSVYRFPTVPRFSLDAMLVGNAIPPMTLVPRSVLGACRFDEDPAKRGCEDWDLWLQLAHAGAECVTVPRVLFDYRLCVGSLSHEAGRMFDSSRCVLDQWIPLANDPRGLRDLAHRLAFGYGAIDLASGSPLAVQRYFADLPPPDPVNGFDLAVAGLIRDAFQFVHGAAGRTWRDHLGPWLADIKTWLENGPMAGRADGIFRHLERIAPGQETFAAATRAFLKRREDACRLLIYGLGTNGLSLLQDLCDPGATGSSSGVTGSLPASASIARVPRFSIRASGATVELVVADDLAGRMTFSWLGLPRDDPGRWRRWPRDTIVVVTPNSYAKMRQTLSTAGGREGTDFIVLADHVAKTCTAVASRID
ncbi:MAG: glycosyltransferase [Gemmatimonadota bacterium]